jgi:hypothetical protein
MTTTNDGMNTEDNNFSSMAKRALRNISGVDERSIERTQKEYKQKRRNYLPKNGFSGLAAGLVVGVIICTAASYIGIPFSATETTFITAQFAMLGALMSYINS